METKLLKLLEFDKVIGLLAECTVTSLGEGNALALLPSSEFVEVERALQCTDEASKLGRLMGGVSLSGVTDTREALKRSLIGGMLAPLELYAVAVNIDVARRLKKNLFDFHEKHGSPLLREQASAIGDHRTLSGVILQSVDESGNVLDQASAELASIRQQIRAAESRVRDKLEQMMRTSSIQKMLQEVLVTIRNERYVLPVKAEYRSSLHGIIHDQSASGATLYIEPDAVVQLNNRMKELKLSEEREIEAILCRLTEQVALVAASLELELDVLARFDLVFAKAKLASRQKAVLPTVNQSGYVRVRKGRHPLLDASSVVPLDLQLGGEYRGIVVTGPNTGGKTVALKTIGLLSLMAMSGMFVPAEEGIELSVFAEIFADIGDEQSIEQNLSTFSGHMKNMIFILDKVTPQSLVLLDEMGAGTDPTEGAALAIAILERLHAVGCRFLATTHYSSLKAYAEEKSDVVNASVEFDTDTLMPTYRLLVGVPGRSNALAIAERLGLPPSILAVAKQQLTEDDQRVERMLQSLEQQRLVMDERQRSLEAEQVQVEQLHQQVQQQLSQLETERLHRMRQAQTEAAALVSKARLEIEQLLADVKLLIDQQKGNSATVKEHQLSEAKRRLSDLTDSVRTSGTAGESARNGTVNPAELSLGDEVKVLTLGQKGKIVQLVNAEEVVVQIGQMRSRVKRASLEKLRDARDILQAEQISRKLAPLMMVSSVEKKPVKLELDVRGQTLDEAIMELDKYLSEVLLAGYTQVTIIHGIGTGVLRKGIQQHLQHHRHVHSHRPGRYGEGDLGVTVVEMK